MRQRHREPPPTTAADRERLLAEEVFYLHSLWRRGPPAPSPSPPPAPIPPRGSGSAAARHTVNRRKRRKLEHRAREQQEEEEQQQQSGLEWPLAPSPPASPTSWHDAAAASSSLTKQHQHPLLQPQRSPGSLAQESALRAAEEFFSNNHEGSESEGSESEDDDTDTTAAGFFMGLFERDAALRGHYERGWVGGEFACMACVGRKWGKGKARRFGGCVGLVQHARAATRCGRPRAHRALAAAVCRVLGWDVERLPSVVIDPRGTLGQALAAAQEENVGAGEKGITSEDEDAAKEDVDPGNKDGSLDNVVAMKANVNVGMSTSLVNDNNGES